MDDSAKSIRATSGVDEAPTAPPARSAAAPKAPLGNTAKSSPPLPCDGLRTAFALPPVSPPENERSEAQSTNVRRVRAALHQPELTASGETGGALDLRSSKPSPQAKRADRYEGLGYARFVLSRHARQLKPNAMAGDVYRTVDCRYVRRDRTVGVHFSAEHQSAHYSSLATCGSVWACPVCCALIQQRRRVELAQLIEWAYANGYRPMMVTFTFPHTAFDSLQELMTKQKQAFELLRKGSPWDKFKKRYGYGGLVRSLELTHGENGWHPHTHEIWLVRELSPIEEVAFVEFVRNRWFKVCERVELVDAEKRFAFMLHAVDVRFGVSQSDYLAKQDSSRAWGADREVATSTSKSGRASGVHPHEFLIRRARGDSSRYLDYVHAMKGRAQLFWSHGLKAKVGVDDVTDEVLADESLEPADLLGLLSADQWALVRRRRKRAQLLDVAETGNWVEVLRFLKSIGWDAYA